MARAVFLLLTLATHFLHLTQGNTCDDDYYCDYRSEEEEGPQAWGAEEEDPRIVTEPLMLVVKEGDEIRLPCQVDHLKGYVILWKKESEIVIVANQVIDKSLLKRSRVEQETDGSTLVLGPVQPGDEGEYSCQVSTYRPTELKHQVCLNFCSETTTTNSTTTTTTVESASTTVGLKSLLTILLCFAWSLVKKMEVVLPRVIPTTAIEDFLVKIFN